MFLPPDTDSRTEMWMVIQMAAAISRANEWVFLGVLLLLLCYAIGRLFWAILKYLYALYKQRLTEAALHAHHFRIALGSALVVALIGALLARSDAYHELGILLLSIDFCLFSLFSVGYDWYLRWREPPQALLPEETTYDDIIAWQHQVNEAYDAGLLIER